MTYLVKLVSSKRTTISYGKGGHAAFALSKLSEEDSILGFWGCLTGDWIKKECNNLYKGPW